MTGVRCPWPLLGGGPSCSCAGSARRLGLTRNEATQAVVVLAGVAFTVLTVVGILFRGAGMALVGRGPVTPMSAALRASAPWRRARVEHRASRAPA